jgi:hypothetical protein
MSHAYLTSKQVVIDHLFSVKRGRYKKTITTIANVPYVFIIIFLSWGYFMRASMGRDRLPGVLFSKEERERIREVCLF